MAQTAMNPNETKKQINRRANSGQLPVNINKKTGIFGKVMKLFILLLILVAVPILGLAGAVHYKLVDPVELDSRWGLSKYPIIGQLFQQTIAEQIAAQSESADSLNPSNHLAPSQPKAVLPKTSNRVLPTQIDDSELKKQEALKLETEQKRLTKVSRLYDGMKAEEAAPILNELDDETVILIFSKMEEERVAKIMTLLDPKRSARLSDAMLKGRIKG